MKGSATKITAPLSLALFALLTAVYLVASDGGLHIIDEVSLFSVTESIAKRGAFDTNTIAWSQWVLSPVAVQGAFGPEGDVFSKKGTAPSFFAVPFYLIGWLVPSLGMLQTTLWFNVIVTALTAVLLAKTAMALGYRLQVALIAGLLYGLATIALPYAKHFFSEPFATFLLVWLVFALVRFRQTRELRYAAWAGLMAGTWIATSIAYAVLLLPVGVYLLYALLEDVRNRDIGKQSWRHLVSTAFTFAVPFVCMLALLAWYNWIRFGTPIGTGRDLGAGEWFTADWGQGLWGLLFSPYRGFFWYTPLAIASVFAFPSFIRRHKAEGWLLAAVAVIAVGLFGKWWMWWSGITWGPRFLVPLAPVVVLALTPWVDRFDWQSKRYWVLAFLIAVSVLVQVLAVSANYVNYEIALRENYPTNPDDSFRFAPPAQFNLFESPILGQVKLLFENPRVNLDVGWISAGVIAWSVPLFGALTVLLAIGAFWFSRRGNWRAVWATALLSVVSAMLLAFHSAQVYSARPEFGEPARGYAAVLDEISQRAGPDDGIVTIAPFLYQVPMTHYRGRLPIYGYSTEKLPLHAETEAVLSRVLVRHPRVWLVTVGLPPASPDNGVEAWLTRNAFKADDRWFDDARLVTFVSAQDTIPLSLNQHFGNQVRLMSAKRSKDIRPGGTLAVELQWQTDVPLKDDLSGFVQILTADGRLIAGNDGIPGGGYLPTTTWKPGVPVSDRRGVLLPSELPSGDYLLIAGVHDAASGERLKTPDGQDHVILDRLTIQ